MTQSRINQLKIDKTSRAVRVKSDFGSGIGSGSDSTQVPAVDQRLENLQQLRVGHELMDTAWRMTVPVVLFAGLGIIVDRSIGSKPWVTLLGTVIGFFFAGLLVKRQIGDTPPFIPSAAYLKKKAEAAKMAGAGKNAKDSKESKNAKYRLMGYDDDEDYYSQNASHIDSNRNVKNMKKLKGKDGRG